MSLKTPSVIGTLISSSSMIIKHTGQLTWTHRAHLGPQRRKGRSKEPGGSDTRQVRTRSQTEGAERGSPTVERDREREGGRERAS